MRRQTSYFAVLIVVAVLVGWFLLSKIESAAREIEGLTPKNLIVKARSKLGSPILTLPVSGSIVSSPVKVIGKAPGTWFFEANLVVKITDEAGVVFGQGPATASLDWMTTSLVPFEAIIPFTPSSDSGFIVIEADNPSGNPGAPSFKVPVKFMKSGAVLECKPSKLAGVCAPETSKSGS